MTLVEHWTGLAPWALAGVAIITFGASFVRGLTGFGMAIILVPLLGMIIAPGEAVVLAIMLQLLIGPVGLNIIIADADRHSAFPIALIAMAATPAGMLLLKSVEPDVARLMIAAVAIGAFVMILLPQHAAGHRPGRTAVGLTGLVSGVLTGFAAMPGPPVVPFYLRQQLDPKIARASMMLVFFGTAIAGTLAAMATGLASQRLAMLALALFGPMLIGNALGARAFGRVSATLWRSFVGVVLGIAGLSAVLRLVN